MSVNPDLQKERQSCTFDVETLTNILDGGPEKTQRRREIGKVLFKEPIFRNSDDRYYHTYSERYEVALQKALLLRELARRHDWTDEELRMANKAARFDFAIAVHDVMFIPALERLGTEEQKAKWLPLARNLQIIGTYAQTEMGHGTNLRRLETVATYDARSQEFVLNTPVPSGMKYWPGGLGKSTNTVLVLAQLQMGGRSHGFQAFIVPIRSLKDHQPLPGVQVGDIGPRLGAPSADNGYLILKNVRIPRLNMLMKYAQVSPDGMFTKSGSDKASYGTMILVRTEICGWAVFSLSAAVVIATRYSCVRRQSELEPGGPEPQVIDYQTQQQKLIPAIAAVYALFFNYQQIKHHYEKVYETELQHGDFKSLAELHSQSSGMKALASEISTDMIEVCRRSCGGHGYLLCCGIADLYCDSLSMVTVEGENTVLYLQTGRYLLKSYAKAMGGDQVPESCAYLVAGNQADRQNTTVRDCLSFQFLAKAFQQRAVFYIRRVAGQFQEQLSSGLPQHQVWNNNSVHLVHAAKAHLDGHLVTNFISCVEGLETSPSVRAVLGQLCRLHACYRVVVSAGDFLESEAISVDQLDKIRNHQLQLLADIRPNAVSLVDAFDSRDEELSSVLGRYDGNVYENLYKAAQKSPLNQTQVHPAYYKYVQPMQRKAKL